jgi:hypothetical protein
MRPLVAVFALLLASVALYVALFALVLDRPLSLGLLRRELDAKLAYAAALPAPKLLILAGSNAVFSHRCDIIGPMLGLPCVNGGIGIGIGLDYQFAHWKPLLKAGDIVYMPLELQQYTVTAAQARQGPDAAIMLRHDRGTLATLGVARWVAAAFSGTAEDAVLGSIEEAAGLLRPSLAVLPTDLDAAGDGIGHSLRGAVASRAFLSHLHRVDPSPPAIMGGYGRAELSVFLIWAAAHDVRVIGGWPTEFADVPTDARLPALLAGVYTSEGAAFLPLGTHGRYPRGDFFDSQDHLAEECQALHSIAVVRGLAPMLGLCAAPPPAWALAASARCPGPGAP